VRSRESKRTRNTGSIEVRRVLDLPPLFAPSRSPSFHANGIMIGHRVRRMSRVEVALASQHERNALENLMQLYIHDFSEHWAGSANGEIGDNGRFTPYPLDAYWREPSHLPLLLRLEGRLVGFALLNDHSHTGRPLDRNVAEFFVVRKHRRGGVGREAAATIFSRFPGQWETAVARRNVAALSFWRRVVTHHPLVQCIEETDVANEVWNGPVLRFRIQPLEA
jgi:predicted acetyltransferase